MTAAPWNPSRSTRILIAVATAWPPIYLLIFIAFFAFSFFSFGSPHTKQYVPDVFVYIFPLHCFTMLLGFALTALYIVHAVRSDRLSQEMRLVWIIILFMGNMLAFPVYWWLYLRSAHGAE